MILGQRRIDTVALYNQVLAAIKDAQKTVEVFEQLAVRAAHRMNPYIRNLLWTNYRKAGIGVVSGQLRACSVTGAVFVYENGYVKIRAASGFGVKVYKRLNAFRYGAVRSKSFTKTHYTDLPTGQQVQYKKGLRTNKHGLASDLGAKVKRSIKKAVLKKQDLSKSQGKAQQAIKQGSFSVIPPKKPFFDLDEYMPQIAEEWGKYFQQEINQYQAKMSQRSA